MQAGRMVTCFSLPLTMAMNWLTEVLPDCSSMVNYTWIAKPNRLSVLLLSCLVRVFYHSSNNETRTLTFTAHHCTHSSCRNCPLEFKVRPTALCKKGLDFVFGGTVFNCNLYSEDKRQGHLTPLMQRSRAGEGMKHSAGFGQALQSLQHCEPGSDLNICFHLWDLDHSPALGTSLHRAQELG